MILYIAGLGWVYITANFVVVSSATKSDQGIVAGIFNVALQVGGSVLGLAVLTAVAQGIDEKYGTPSHPANELSQIGYQSVYYSCIILCGIGLFISLFAIKVPETSSFAQKPTIPTSNPPELPLETLNTSSKDLEGTVNSPMENFEEANNSRANHSTELEQASDH